MGDPHRLLSTMGDGDDLERELLASIRRADPPEHAKAEAWARLSTQIAAVALVSSAHGSAAAASGGAAAEGAKAAAGVGVKGALAPALLKVVGSKAAIAVAVATIGASAVWVHARSTAVQSASTAQSVAPFAPAPQAASAPPAPVAALVDPDPQPASDPTARPNAEQRRRDQLSAESALLTDARAELRKGDALGAQRILSRLQLRFPKGVLGQEREVLAIEVLAARGNAAAAKRRAQAFIAAYPESPHSAQLARFADAP